ncbi:MAG TPA: AAA family ATPase, partial [bacterium]|nr:AAA family ATPase [bacterium]
MSGEQLLQIILDDYHSYFKDCIKFVDFSGRRPYAPHQVVMDCIQEMLFHRNNLWAHAKGPVPIRTVDRFLDNAELLLRAAAIVEPAEQIRELRERSHSTVISPEPIMALEQVRQLVRELTNTFFGREDAIVWLDKSLASADRGVIVVAAPGGMGKSALLANWSLRQEKKGARIVRHFFNHLFPSTIQPADALRSLLLQLAEFDVAYRRDAAHDETKKLVDAVASALISDATPETPLILILDGLDEADPDEEGRPIERWAPPRLGRHVHVVVSGRAERGETPDYLARWLAGGVQYPVRRFDLEPLGIEGVVAWLQATLPSTSTVEADRIAEHLKATTGGIPLFLRYVIDDLAQKLSPGQSPEILLMRVENLPASFTAYAREQLLTLRSLPRSGTRVWEGLVERLFALLTIIKGGIGSRELARVLGEKRLDFKRIDPAVSRWFAIRTGKEEADVSFPHPQLAQEFAKALSDDPMTVDLVQQMRDELLAHCREWRDHKGLYALTHFPELLLEAGKIAECAATLTSVAFLSSRLESAKAEELIHQTDRDFEQLGNGSLEDWMYFWHTISPRLRQNLEGFGKTTASELLIQLALDAEPGGAVARAAEKQLRGHRVDWAQVAGYHGQRMRPSNHNRDPLEGMSTLRLSDNRILSWQPFYPLWEVTGGSNVLQLWSVTSDPGLKLTGHELAVLGALELKDGRILSWSYDGTLRLWSAKDEPGPVLRGHTHFVNGALELEDGRILSWSSDGTVRLWSSDGARIAELEHDRDIDGALTLSDGRILL